MIDWITAKLPFTHKSAISDGLVVHLDEKRDRQFYKLKRKELRGSFETGIHVWTEMGAETLDGDFSTLWVSGNPVKLFQGHNVWGSNDLQGLLIETFEFLAASLVEQGAVPTANDTVTRFIVAWWQLSRSGSHRVFPPGYIGRLQGMASCC